MSFSDNFWLSFFRLFVPWAGSDNRSTKLLFQSRFAASEGLCNVFLCFFFSLPLVEMIEISYQFYDVPQTNTKINRDVAEKTRKSNNVAYVPTWNDGKTPRHRCRSETEALPSMEPVAQEQSLESRTGRTGWQRFTGKMIFKRFFWLKIRFGDLWKKHFQHWRYQMISAVLRCQILHQ